MQMAAITVGNGMNKFRFTVTVNSIERELFSLREWKGTDVMLVSKTPKLFEFATNDMRPFKNQHYSVHFSNELTTMITQKTELVDGTSISVAALIEDVNEHLFWPIHARRLNAFEGDDRALKPPKSKESIVNIGTLDQNQAMLMYSLFVARSGFDYAVLENPFSTVYAVNFSKFQIIFIYGYINLPAYSDGDITAIMTSTAQVNGVRVGTEFKTARTSAKTDLIGVHWKLMHSLADKFLERIVAEDSDWRVSTVVKMFYKTFLKFKKHPSISHF
jgi:hypothetical protein